MSSGVVPVKRARLDDGAPLRPDLVPPRFHAENLNLRDLKSCPWCSEEYPTGTLAVYFSHHFQKCHAHVPGPILACSRCPSARFRGYSGLQIHMEVAGCGGTTIFKTAEAVRSQDAEAQRGIEVLEIEDA